MEIATTSEGVRRVAAERQKQVAKYDDAHDDKHNKGELAAVAADLALAAADCIDNYIPEAGVPDWADDLYEKHGEDKLRMLEIAGALICAEIDRLLREQARA